LDQDATVRLAVTGTDPTADLSAEVAALVLDALTHAMATGGPDRFGTCVGAPCACVYVDRTRAARQRFCCQLCNDRVAAAAYRSRRAASVT
jgi:predicted RNA-binding Zn ribbon-like protein